MPRPPFPGLWARRRPLASVAAAAATLLLATASPASADIHTWVGGGANGSWSDASKWAGGIPGFNSNEPRPIVVQFDTNTVSTMNISGLVVDEIRFLGSGNVINGTSSQTLGLSGQQSSTNLRSGAGGNRIASTLPIALGGRAVSINSAAGFFTLEGPITGGANTTLTFSAGANAGTTVTGSIATGRALVASGELGLDNSSASAAIQSATVQIGDGDGDDGGATLKTFRNEELSPTADIFVNEDGTLELGFNTQSVGTLTLDRGAVKVDSFLGVSAGLSMEGGTVSGTGILGLVGDATLGSTTAGTPATISTRMELVGERTFTVSNGAAATDATLSGILADDPGVLGSLVKAGAGTLRLSPSGPNTYGGRTLVREGTLELLASSGQAIPPTPSPLEIGDNTGPASSASVDELADNDINQTTPVRVGTDGRLAMGGFVDTIASLQSLGVVDLPARSMLSVVGETSVSSTVTGTGVLRLGIGGPSQLILPSTPVGPPRIEAQIQLFSATEVFVTQGITAELAGGFGPAPNNVSPTVTKVGLGTLTLARQPANGPLGLTTVRQGTLVMNGLVSSPFAVEAGATLAGNGAVGALTVGGPAIGAIGGTIAPSAPGFKASNVTFAAGGRLRSVIPAGSIPPPLLVDAGVTIDQAAILDLQLAPGLARATAPTQLGLITKTAPGPIAGRFAGVAEGAELTPGPGLGYTFGYSAGDGNDLVGQLRNAAPAASITGFASGRAAAQVGASLTFAASAADADADPLTFTWEFGDGATATGATVSHFYGEGAVGQRTAKVTVSDGRLTSTATIPVDVTSPPSPTPSPAPPTAATPVPPGGGGAPTGPGSTPLADTVAPVLTFTVAKGQTLSKNGTINARLRCTEACTVTLATSVKPPGSKAKTRTATTTVKLPAGASRTVAVGVPKGGLAAVRSGLRRKQKSTLAITATARDNAGNAAKPIRVKAALTR